MRNIEFRAWRESSQQMMPSNTLMQLMQLWSIAGGLANPDGVKWMQFTGLIDKNGAKIFECDLVKHENGIAQVTYNDEIAAFDFNLSDCVVCQEAGVFGGDMEVIGNIFQNADLLED